MCRKLGTETLWYKL